MWCFMEGRTVACLLLGMQLQMSPPAATFWCLSMGRGQMHVCHLARNCKCRPECNCMSSTRMQLCDIFVLERAIACLLLVCVNVTRSFTKGQSTLLNRQYLSIYAGLSNPFCGVERITHPRLIIRVSWLWWWRLRWTTFASPRCSWMEAADGTSFMRNPSKNGNRLEPRRAKQHNL